MPFVIRFIFIFFDPLEQEVKPLGALNYLLEAPGLTLRGVAKRLLLLQDLAYAFRQAYM